MTGTIIIVLLFFINLTIWSFSVFYMIRLWKLSKEDVELKKDMFQFSLPINDEDNFNILDRIIQHELEIYQIYNFPKYADDTYISEDDQNKMMKEVMRQTLRKISPIYMDKLKYIYNEDIIEDIIFEKIRDGVLQFSVEINGTFRDKDKK